MVAARQHNTLGLEDECENEFEIGICSEFIFGR